MHLNDLERISKRFQTTCGFQDVADHSRQTDIFQPWRNRGTFAQHHVESLDLDATCVDCVQASFPGISDQEV